MRRHSADSERYHIRAVDRALSLLRVFLDSDGDLSATEISRLTGLDPSTTFRLLVTLQAQGFVEQDAATGKYRLGVACLELGSRFLRSNDLRRRALGTMEALRDEFGETVHLALLEGNEVVYLEKVAGLHPIGLMSSRAGGRAPAYCTGVGKVLLAYLSEAELRRRYPSDPLPQYTPTTITSLDALQSEVAGIRRQGFAVDREEHEVGVKCFAVPIFDHKGVAAAMSVSGPVERIDQHNQQGGLVEKLQQAAARISAQMGGRLAAGELDGGHGAPVAAPAGAGRETASSARGDGRRK